jgi:hypothetical protein
VKRRKQCCPGPQVKFTGIVMRVKPLSSTYIWASRRIPCSKQVRNQEWAEQGTYTAAVAIK